jgi:hypothetical protein
VADLEGDDLQRLTIDPGRIQPEIKRALAFGQALAGRGLERFILTPRLASWAHTPAQNLA